MIRVYVGNNLNRTPVDVTSDTTLRKVLEDANVDYGVGMTSLDGATLKPGDLDKTFAEMNVTGEKCYLLNTAKAVNAAASIKVLAGTAVIESEFTPEEIQEIQKYRPKAMKLVDEKENPIFTVAKVAKGNGSINSIGAEFGVAKTNAGKACIKLEIPDGEKAKDYIEEKVGVSILNLQRVESCWAGTLEAIKAEKDAVLGTIQEL